MNDTVIRVGGAELQPVGQKEQRISMLLWGSSGTGKTTLACTAPGRKLLVMFDPDGDASVTGRDDVDVADLSAAKSSVVESFKSDANPLGLAKAMEGYDTVIIDSLTNAQHMALMYGVSTIRAATVETPSKQGWGYRTTLVTQLVKNVLMVTKRHNKHVIFTAHEAQPERNDEGVVMSITIALGGQLVTQAPVDFSEVFNVTDTGKSRRIAIRPTRMRMPMKTRMFVTNQAPEFEWKHTGDEIERWYTAWKESGYKKQPLP